MLAYRRIRRLTLALALAIALPLTVAPASPASADAGYFTLHSKLNDKCLEIQIPSYNGQRANMFDCHYGWNQQWRWSGNQIINRATNTCLEILNIDPSEGAYVGVWGCWAGANQRWSWGRYLISQGWELQSHLNGQCLEIRDSWPHNGAYVSMWGCWGGAATSWVAVY
jgi:hypothetical protein